MPREQFQRLHEVHWCLLSRRYAAVAAGQFLTKQALPAAILGVHRYLFHGSLLVDSPRSAACLYALIRAQDEYSNHVRRILGTLDARAGVSTSTGCLRHRTTPGRASNAAGAPGRCRTPASLPATPANEVIVNRNGTVPESGGSTLPPDAAQSTREVRGVGGGSSRRPMTTGGQLGTSSKGVHDTCATSSKGGHDRCAFLYFCVLPDAIWKVDGDASTTVSSSNTLGAGTNRTVFPQPNIKLPYFCHASRLRDVQVSRGRAGQERNGSVYLCPAFIMLESACATLGDLTP